MFSFRVMAVCAVLCIAGAPLVRAQGFAVPETIFAYSGDGGDVGQYGRVLHDLAGNLHSAYFDATHNDLKYAYGTRDPFTGFVSWTVQRVDTQGDVGRHCDIAVTLDARPIISYLDNTNGALKIAFDQNGDGDFEQDAMVFGRNDITGFFEIQTVDDTAPSTGLYTSVAIDDDNVIHISYKNQTAGSLQYAVGDGVTWTLETADPGPQTGNYTSLVLDNRQATNIPYIFYQDEMNLDLRGVRRIGGAWFTVPSTGILDADGETGFYIDAVITPANDRIYVTYLDLVTAAPNRTDLKMAIIDELAPPTTELVQSCVVSVVVPCGLQVVTGDRGYYASIALDRNGLPTIGHYDNGNGQLMFERRGHTNFPMMGEDPRDIWQTKLLPEDSGNVGLFTSVSHFTYTDPFSMTDLDVAHLGHYDESRQMMRLATVTAGAVTTPTATIVDGAKAGEFSSLALDRNGVPTVAYYDTVQGSLYLSRRSGPPLDPWEAPILIDNSDSYRGTNFAFIEDPHLSPFNSQQSGHYPSMVIDPVGTAHIAYYDRLRTQLRYATLDEGATTPNLFLIETGPKRGEFASQAMNSDGTEFAIAYFQEFEDSIPPDSIGNGPRLRVAIGDGASNWTIESVDASGVVGKYCSAVYDDSGDLHVSYFDETNFNLKYAVRSGGIWLTQTVEDSFDLDGQYTSIGINPLTDQPVISYYDLSNSSLKFAQYDGLQWQIATVDEIGNVGLHSDLTIDRDRNIVYIAYYDLTNGALKIASKTLLSPTWDSFTTIDDVGDVGFRPSTIIDSEGFIRASYYDISRGDLRYTQSAILLLNNVESWERYE